MINPQKQEIRTSASGENIIDNSDKSNEFGISDLLGQYKYQKQRGYEEQQTYEERKSPRELTGEKRTYKVKNKCIQNRAEIVLLIEHNRIKGKPLVLAHGYIIPENLTGCPFTDIPLGLFRIAAEYMRKKVAVGISVAPCFINMMTVSIREKNA